MRSKRSCDGGTRDAIYDSDLCRDGWNISLLSPEFPIDIVELDLECPSRVVWLLEMVAMAQVLSHYDEVGWLLDDVALV